MPKSTSSPPSSSSAQVDILPEVLTDALHKSCGEASMASAPDSHQPTKGYYTWHWIRTQFQGEESGKDEDEVVAPSSNEEDELEVTAFQSLL